MTVNHPDPEGHLTDLTITKLRDYRDLLVHSIIPMWALEETTVPTARVLRIVVEHLDAILEPWGEGTVDG